MKKIPGLAYSVLRFLDAEDLSWLSTKAGTKDSERLLKIAREIVKYNEDNVMAMNSADPALATNHAYAKGSSSTMTLMVYLIEGARDEIARRKKENKGKVRKDNSGRI